jgi:hypothetical protein
MKKLLLILINLVIFTGPLLAQDHQHHQPAKKVPVKKTKTPVKAKKKPAVLKGDLQKKFSPKVTTPKAVAPKPNAHQPHVHSLAKDTINKKRDEPIEDEVKSVTSETEAYQHQAHHAAKDTSLLQANTAGGVKENATVPKNEANNHETISGEKSSASHQRHDGMLMTQAYSLNIPMSRNGSGTAWLPDASPMFMYMKGNNRTSFMLHGNVFLRYTQQNVNNKALRGGQSFGAPNWFMGMVNKRVGQKGLFNATAMISLDPLTEGGNGYPLLFQSGETFKGRRLVDRQHPHDLVSGLTVGYSHAFTKDVDLFGYVGYPGEPALNGTAFMHRVSALNNPDAPLGHHWQDATHITFGVATAGLRYKNLKAEFSSFTGREPNEDRYDFEKARFDSYSYRLSYNPTPNWALQFSQGNINSPEGLGLDEEVKRTTASAIHTTSSANPNSFIATSLLWGLNDAGGYHKEHSVLLESNLQVNRKSIYGRYEFVQKSAGELDLETTLGHADFNINALTLGYNYNIFPTKHIDVLAGAQGTLNVIDKKLEPFYGKSPLSWQVYLQFRPSRHK